MLLRVLPLIVLSFLSFSTLADDGTKKEPARKIIYHQLKPDITTNLDSSSDKKNKDEELTMNTITVRFSLMIDTVEDAEVVKTHEALYKDQIILFINKQMKENLKTRRQKIQFKKKLKNILNKTLQAEIKRPDIIKRLLVTRMIID